MPCCEPNTTSRSGSRLEALRYVIWLFVLGVFIFIVRVAPRQSLPAENFGFCNYSIHADVQELHSTSMWGVVEGKQNTHCFVQARMNVSNSNTNFVRMRSARLPFHTCVIGNLQAASCRRYLSCRTFIRKSRSYHHNLGLKTY